jgi:hypothetical protein
LLTSKSKKIKVTNYSGSKKVFRNEQIYYKPKAHQIKQSPAQFSSPMLKQTLQKRTQNSLQKPTSNFKKGVSNGTRNVNHIMKKYDHVKPNAYPKVESNQQKTKNILDSINKNINGPKIQQQRVFPKRVLNPPQKILNKNVYQKKSIPARSQELNMSNQLYKGNTAGNKSNKFLVKNGPRFHNSQIAKKRNFSPIESHKKIIPNQIFNNNKESNNIQRSNIDGGKKIIRPSNTQNTNDSLGGGSKINTKTGSMLNFGGGSRIPDNLSVISR